MRFADLRISDDTIIGTRIEVAELFGKRIVVEKYKIKQSKFKRVNGGGKCMLMQVVFAKFNAVPDADGDYFVKDESGKPVGERHFTSTGSDVLIDQAQQAEAMMKNEGKPFYLDTTIQKIGKSYQFT